MSLPAYQELVYWDRCDLWEPDVPVPAGQFPGDQVYTLQQEDVRCRFVVRSGVDALNAAGLLSEGDDLITVDEIRLPEGTEIESSWIIVNRTRVNGAEGPYFNKVWIARGGPKKRISPPGLPRVGRVVAFVSKLPGNALPAEIAAHYA